jgi:hypothetical protein
LCFKYPKRNKSLEAMFIFIPLHSSSFKFIQVHFDPIHSNTTQYNTMQCNAM